MLDREDINKIYTGSIKPEILSKKREGGFIDAREDKIASQSSLYAGGVSRFYESLEKDSPYRQAISTPVAPPATSEQRFSLGSLRETPPPATSSFSMKRILIESAMMAAILGITIGISFQKGRDYERFYASIIREKHEKEE